MAYGSMTVNGVAGDELAQLRKEIAEAKDTAQKAQEGLKEYSNAIPMVPTQVGTLIYTGEELTPEWSNFDEEALEISGVTTATDVGTYEVSFTPKEGHQWTDRTTAPRTATWSISLAVTQVPSQVGTLTYTGKQQQPQWADYSPAKVTLSGATVGTNAGIYNAIATPADNYQWPDGTRTEKTIPWSIQKAAATMTVNKSSMQLNGGGTETITVTRDGDGTVTATSSQTAVATVAVTGNTVTVTGRGAGTATITVSVAEGTNYLAPASASVAVTVKSANPDLSQNTASAIQEAIQSGQASNLWSVGDSIPIKMNGKIGNITVNDTFRWILIGIDHNAGVEGARSCHFMLGKNSSGVDIALCDSNYNTLQKTGFIMNPQTSSSTYGTNAGGWRDCYMRNTIMPQVLASLPPEFQAIIVPCTKYTDNVGNNQNNASSVTATSDKMFLLAEFEVFGARTWANSAEQNYQKQYTHFANGNSRVKYNHTSTGAAVGWGLRSPRYPYSSAFGAVDTGGSDSNYGAAHSLGLVSGFKVA